MCRYVLDTCHHKSAYFLLSVHGFIQADYDLNEDEFLDTVFRLNVKGMTQFGGALVVSGSITAAADGTSSKITIAVAAVFSSRGLSLKVLLIFSN